MFRRAAFLGLSLLSLGHGSQLEVNGPFEVNRLTIPQMHDLKALMIKCISSYIESAEKICQMNEDNSKLSDPSQNDTSDEYIDPIRQLLADSQLDGNCSKAKIEKQNLQKMADLISAIASYFKGKPDVSGLMD